MCAGCDAKKTKTISDEVLQEKYDNNADKMCLDIPECKKCGQQNWEVAYMSNVED